MIKNSSLRRLLPLAVILFIAARAAAQQVRDAVAPLQGPGGVGGAAAGQGALPNGGSPVLQNGSFGLGSILPGAGYAAMPGDPAQAQQTAVSRLASTQDGRQLLYTFLAQPEFLQDPAVRQEAVKAFGAAAVADIEAQGRANQGTQAHQAENRQFLRRLRSEAKGGPLTTPEAVAARIRAVAAALGSASSPETFAAFEEDAAAIGRKHAAELDKASRRPYHYTHSGWTPPLESGWQSNPDFASDSFSTSRRSSGLLARLRGWGTLATAALMSLGAAAGLMAAPQQSSAQDEALHRLANPPPGVVLQVERETPDLLRAQQAESADYIEVEDINDLNRRWSPDNPVYVIGKLSRSPLRIDETDLRRLAGELKGKHWVVVIVPSYSGQRFSGDGSNRYDKEAVEYGLSQGVEQDSRFKAWKHAGTGQPDGKVFYMEVEHKAHNYIGSEAQNSRGLDTHHYNGNLELPFLNQMKRNRDVVQAIRNLTESIDTQLDQAVVAEKAEAERAARALVTDARSAVRQAGTRVNELQQAQAALVGSNVAAARKLARNDIASLTEKVQAAQNALDAGNHRRALDAANGVIRTVDSALAAINGFTRQSASAQEAIARAETTVSGLSAKVPQFQREFPNLSGDIGRPEGVSALQAEVASAKTTLKNGQPEEAAEAARRASAKADEMSQAMDGYRTGGQALSDMKSRLEAVEKDRFASDARVEVLNARQAYQDADAQYTKGDSAYVTSIAAADQSIKSAERVVSDAAAEHARNVFLGFLALLLSLLTLGTAGFFMNRRARKVGADAVKELADWEKVLGAEQERLYLQLQQDMRTWAGEPNGTEGSFDYEGETLRISDEARAYFELMEKLWEKAKQTLEKAQGLAKPARFTPRWTVNQFFPVNFNKALGELKKTLDFLPEDGLDKTLGIARASALKEKLGKVKKGKSYTFQDLMSLYDEMNDAVGTDLTQIQEAKAKVGPEMTRVEGLVVKAEGLKAGLDAAGKDDGLFLIPTIFSDLLPAARKTLGVARAKMVKDPVGAMKKSAAEAIRLSQDAHALADLVGRARAVKDAAKGTEDGPITAALAAQKALKEAGIETEEWLDKEIRRLSGEAERLAVKASDSGQDPLAVMKDGQLAGGKIFDLRQKIAAFADKTTQAASLDKARREIALPKIADAQRAVAEARARIATARGVGASEVFTEKWTKDMAAEIQEALLAKANAKGSDLEPEEIQEMMEEIAESKTLDPSAKLAKASALVEKARKALDKGENEAAIKLLDDAGDFHDVARAIVDQSLGVLEKFDGVLATRKTETDRLAGTRSQKGEVANAQESLDRIETEFAESVLTLSAGDLSHPKSDGTVKNNIDEANAELASAADKTEKAVTAFNEGKFLRAATLLDQVEAHQEIAAHRLKEITEKEARLRNTAASNKTHLETLEGQSTGALARIESAAVTQQPTINAIKDARKALKAAKEAVEEAQGDPFTAEAGLRDVSKSFNDIVNVIAKNDQDIFNEASRSVTAAESALKAAQEQARRAQVDKTEDSPAIRQAYRNIEALEKSIPAARRDLSVQHGNWSTLDKEADSLAAKANEAAATLRKEVEEAAQASAAITNASSKVRDASTWKGDYGLYIDGSPGSGSIDTARKHLENGNYAEAMRSAQRAQETAIAAIAAKQAEESAERDRRRRAREAQERREREEREEQERQAAARRRRSDDSSSSWGSGSSSGGSSWGGSSSGGSSYGGGGSSWGGGGSSGGSSFGGGGSSW